MQHYTINDLQDVATSQEHRTHLLKMLQQFDAFCRKHEIQYYLSGGTLLGAVRNKGFIPWDDDIDVNVPRRECERLLALSDGKIGNYTFIPPTYEGERFSYQYRMCDDTILLGRKEGGELVEELQPAFIDIFPIDGLPSSEEENSKYFKKLVELKARVRRMIRQRPYGGMNLLKRAARDYDNNRLKRIGLEKLFNDVIEHQKSLTFEESEYVGVTSIDVHNLEERIKKDEYATPIELEFEGGLYFAPQCYDKYLTQIYGPGYIYYPPVHKRITKHLFLPFKAKENNKDKQK